MPAAARKPASDAVTISFSAVQFAEAAKAIGRIPEARTKIPILSTALMKTVEGGLTLTMTDLDIVGTIRIDGDWTGCVEGFRAALPRPVLDFFAARADAKASNDRGEIEFAADGRSLVARHGRARMSHLIQLADDFPDSFPAKDDADCRFSLPADEFCRLASLCEPAFSTEETRFYLQGACLRAIEGDLVMVGLDGHRMHAERIDAPEGAEGLKAPIVPSKAIREVVRIFGDSEAPLTIEVGESRVSFESGAVRIVSKLIDGTYPDFERLIDRPGAFRIHVDGPALERAIAGLLVIPKSSASGKGFTSRAVRIAADGPDQILLQMRGDDGEIEDRIPARIEAPGEACDIVGNAIYLRDALAAIGQGGVSLALGEHNANAIRIISRRETQTFLVMAMRW